MSDPFSDTDRLTAAWDALLLTLGGPPLENAGTPAGLESSPPVRIPVTVLGGFLGAGKTTLLCHLLETSPIEILAIVNDVASVNVDAAQIRSRDTETIALQNGCACCVLGSDLRETLHEIGCRPHPPGAIVIEASGVADPHGIAQTVANVESMVLDGIVTVVDARTFAERASDPVTAPLFARQLGAAHLVVLTKTPDACDAAELRQRVGALAPGRPVLFSDAGEAGADALLGAALLGARPSGAADAHDASAFAVATVLWRTPVCAAKFFAVLDAIPEAVYRVKGWVWLNEPEPSRARRTGYNVQAVGSQWRVQTSTAFENDSQLVVIGRKDDRTFEHFMTALGRLEHADREPAAKR